MAKKTRATVRDESKQETRDALIRAGTELFAKEGLDAPSLDAICARAGFTRGAFYVHFADREDFIVAVMERATGRFLDAVMPQGADIDLGAVCGAFAAVTAEGGLRVFGQVPPHQLLAACARSPALRKKYTAITAGAVERLAEIVRAGQRQKAIRRDTDPTLLATLLVAAALGAEVMNEVKVPFDASGAAATMMRLLSRDG